MWQWHLWLLCQITKTHGCSRIVRFSWWYVSPNELLFVNWSTGIDRVSDLDRGRFWPLWLSNRSNVFSSCDMTFEKSKKVNHMWPKKTVKLPRLPGVVDFDFRKYIGFEVWSIFESNGLLLWESLELKYHLILSLTVFSVSRKVWTAGCHFLHFRMTLTAR